MKTKVVEREEFTPGSKSYNYVTEEGGLFICGAFVWLMLRRMPQRISLSVSKRKFAGAVEAEIWTHQPGGPRAQLYGSWKLLGGGPKAKEAEDRCICGMYLLLQRWLSDKFGLVVDGPRVRVWVKVNNEDKKK
jgi:hypothetical protein